MTNDDSILTRKRRSLPPELLIKIPHTMRGILLQFSLVFGIVDVHVLT